MLEIVLYALTAVGALLALYDCYLLSSHGSKGAQR